MTVAWYGHLKYKSMPIIPVVFTCWGIAFIEYCFQVPANRIGYGRFTGAQLKIIQEVLSLSTFAVFSTLYLKEKMTWNYLVGFVLMLGAVFFVFKKW